MRTLDRPTSDNGRCTATKRQEEEEKKNNGTTDEYQKNESTKMSTKIRSDETKIREHGYEQLNV